MIRAKMLFSIVLIAFVSSACQKEGKRPVASAPKNAVNPALKANQKPVNLTGGDTSLGQGQVSGPVTVRGQKADLDNSASEPTAAPSDADQQMTSVPAAKAMGNTAATGVDDVEKLYPQDYRQFYQRENDQSENNEAVQHASEAAVAAAAPAEVATPSAAEAASAETATAADVPSDSTVNVPVVNDPNVITSIGSADSTAVEPVSGQAVVVSPTLAVTKDSTDPKWTPGVARDLAPSAVFTNGLRNSKDGAAYTDAKYDSIMAALWDGYNANPDILNGNQDLAVNITGVQLASFDGKSYTLAVNLKENGNEANLIFHGVRGKSLPKTTKKKTKIKTVTARIFDLDLQTDSKSKAPLLYRYHARVLCSDKEIHSCENAVIELGRFDLHAENHAKPISKAFIVHRLGSAVVTFNHEESAAGNHLLFNKFLASTTHKICLSEEKTAKGADKTKLKSICPKNNKTVNGADDIMMRTWAVAGGAAKYEIIFASAHDDKDVYFSQSLVWSGDLVMVAENANETAVVTDRAHSGRDAWFKDKSIQLVNSDGAGALNFKLSFDDPAEEERISVVSNFAASKAPKLKKKQKDNAKVANDATPTKRS